MRMIMADDHALVLDALENYLTLLQPEIEIGKATCLDCALDLVEDGATTDLVLLDLNMPGMNGFEGLGRTKEVLPGVPVVLMSGQAVSAEVREGLRLGAAGFIPKNLDGQSMLKALELILSGETYVPLLALQESDAADADHNRPSPPATGTLLGRLTSRQHTVLKLLLRGLTNKAIARELGLKEVTVAVHLGHVFRKLGVSNRTEAVSKASRLGLAA